MLMMIAKIKIFQTIKTQITKSKKCHQLAG
jgi:hypothetical protein